MAIGAAPQRVPEHAYTPLPPGAAYQPAVPASAQPAGAHAAVHRLGAGVVRGVHGGLRLLGSQGGAGDGSGHSNLDPRHRPGAALSPPLLAARERDHHRHRRPGRIGGCGGGVHAARALPAQASTRTRCRPSSSAWPAAASASCSSSPLAATSCAKCTASFPIPKPRPSRKCWSPAKRAARRRACCSKPRRFPACTISSSPPSMSGRNMWTSSSWGFMRVLSERAKVAVSFDAIGFILGLGYVMGLRSSMILCAGGVLSNFVLVPLVWMIGSHISTGAVYPATTPNRRDDGRAEIFRGYVRFVGVGAIATARHLRHPEIHEDRGRILRGRATRLPPRRGRGRAHGPRYFHHGHPAGRSGERHRHGGFLREPEAVRSHRAGGAQPDPCCSRFSSPPWPPTPSPPRRATRSPA